MYSSTIRRPNSLYFRRLDRLDLVDLGMVNLDVEIRDIDHCASLLLSLPTSLNGGKIKTTPYPSWNSRTVPASTKVTFELFSTFRLSLSGGMGMAGTVVTSPDEARVLKRARIWTRRNMVWVMRYPREKSELEMESRLHQAPHFVSGYPYL
ncbi:hypothetical protein FA13DRAFT_1738770 [Coprinellus micaceus]|uniref:Uncharacterized protein n=1 Tax=Coprinellus micaceus TaxID=71717 RepID=A0A4Y7SUP0_COPMI|nr:hypothetical protein FA13DRAFT_1738770 [Coprinellus micaceus]